ncbi:11-oxo-beta-amyrin 30-oxidase, partial [Mucuna pruriens]
MGGWEGRDRGALSECSFYDAFADFLASHSSGFLVENWFHPCRDVVGFSILIVPEFLLSLLQSFGSQFSRVSTRKNSCPTLRFEAFYRLEIGPVLSLLQLPSKILFYMLVKVGPGKTQSRTVLGCNSEKWNKHRKIINLAFHLEKLKNMLPAFSQSCHDMISTWMGMFSSDGTCEIDVWPFLQNLTCDVISRTAFGSSYAEGTRIFQLLKMQGYLFMTAQYKDIPILE